MKKSYLNSTLSMIIYKQPMKMIHVICIYYDHVQIAGNHLKIIEKRYTKKSTNIGSAGHLAVVCLSNMSKTITVT